MKGVHDDTRRSPCAGRDACGGRRAARMLGLLIGVVFGPFFALTVGTALAQPGVSEPQFIDDQPRYAEEGTSEGQWWTEAEPEFAQERPRPRTLSEEYPDPQPPVEDVPAGRATMPRSPVGRTPGMAEAILPDPGESIVEVRIEGNITIPPAAIARYIKTRPDRPASEQQIREDVRALYGTRWFFSVEPHYRRTDRGLVLAFKVVERPVVSKVEYRGANKVKEKFLAAQTGLKVGSPYDVSANREAARRLEDYYREKGFGFASVDLERGGHPDDREVIFRINEGAKVKVTSVDFIGNESFSDSLLKMKLRTKTAILWMIGGKYDPSTIPDDIAALKQYYHQLGYFDVQIEEKVLFSADRSNAKIEYHIVEGTRYKLRNLHIEGNEIYSEDVLRQDLKLLPGHHFNARFLEKDVQSIKGKYGEKGHIFAQVDAVPRFLETPGEADLVYRIDEDKPYIIGRINVHVNGDYPHTQRKVVLNTMQHLTPGELADPAMVEKARKRLNGSGLFERTPQDAAKISLSRREPRAPTLDEVYRGQEAAYDLPPNVQRTELRTTTGGDHTPAAHTTRTARPVGTTGNFVPSGPRSTTYTPFTAAPRFEEPVGQTVIRGQNAFEGPVPPPSNPLFAPNPQGDPFNDMLQGSAPPWVQVQPGIVDLDVDVVEARTGRLMFGIGVNSDAGVVGNIVLSEDNFDITRVPTSFQDIIDGRAFRGAGQKFRLEAVPGSEVSRYLVSFTEPFLFDTPYSLGVSGFYFTRFYEDWDEERAGGRIQFGRQFTPEWSANVAVRLENVEIENPEVPTPQLLQDALGSHLLSTVRGTIAHDTRDTPFLPGEGHYVSASVEQAFGDFDYTRGEIEANQYFTLYSRPDGGGRHILALMSQFGLTSDETPIFERFYAGGFQTFRGFAFRGIGPEDLDVKIGGEFLALGSVEYQFPLMANEMIRGVAFTDFGTVEEDVGFDDFRVTAGFGFRLTVPAMGPAPLAFDFAFPILSEDTDDERIFSFFVGFTR